MPTKKLERLRSEFTTKLNHFLTQQSTTYRQAAEVICINDKLQQDIFEGLTAVLQTNDLTAAKKSAARALHACDKLDSSMHFLLSYRTLEQQKREAEIQELAAEFNSTIAKLTTQVRHV